MNQYNKAEEIDHLKQKLKKSDLRSLKVNFLTLNTPILNLYKTENFQKTMEEFLNLPKNMVFYHPPSNSNREHIFSYLNN
jgi:hypothetical protein